MDVHDRTGDRHEEGVPCNSGVRPDVCPPVSSHTGGGDLLTLASCPVAVVCPKSEPRPDFHDDYATGHSCTLYHKRTSRVSHPGTDLSRLGQAPLQSGAEHQAFAAESVSGSGMVPCMIDEEEGWLSSRGIPASPHAVGEGAERVHPAPSREQKGTDISASDALFKDCHSSEPSEPPSTWRAIAWDWMFPPMRSYEELCENVATRALGILHTDTWLRRMCVYAVKSKCFERLSLALILVNCIFLALDSKDPDHPSTLMGAVLRYTEWFFMVAFSVEMVLKILGLGLYHASGAYMRDGWNVVDCVVVVVGWLSLLPSITNISAMRSVRVLRPLRTITGVEGMRMLVATLLRSLPMLLDVLILCAFLFLIFGTIGVQTFSGVLRHRCGQPEVGTVLGSLIFNVSAVAVDESEACGDGLISLPLEGAWFDTNGAAPYLEYV